jgi:hypothetical protein
VKKLIRKKPRVYECDLCCNKFEHTPYAIIYEQEFMGLKNVGVLCGKKCYDTMKATNAYKKLRRGELEADYAPRYL